MQIKQIEYICTYCGQKTIRNENHGRPLPGICIRKGKTRDGRNKPHSWSINRRL